MNKTQTIAVIAINELDFRNFKLRHQCPDKVFHRVICLEDIRGRYFHDVDETDGAWLNDDYFELKEIAKARVRAF